MKGKLRTPTGFHKRHRGRQLRIRNYLSQSTPRAQREISPSVQSVVLFRSRSRSRSRSRFATLHSPPGASPVSPLCALCVLCGSPLSASLILRAPSCPWWIQIPFILQPSAFSLHPFNPSPRTGRRRNLVPDRPGRFCPSNNGAFAPQTKGSLSHGSQSATSRHSIPQV